MVDARRLHRIDNIQGLGNPSYSLYLTHAFIALAAVKFFLSHGGHLWLAAIMLPVTYVGSVIIAFCAYKYVERPITGRLRSAIGDAAKSLRAREPSPTEKVYRCHRSQ